MISWLTHNLFWLWSSKLNRKNYWIETYIHQQPGTLLFWLSLWSLSWQYGGHWGSTNLFAAFTNSFNFKNGFGYKWKTNQKKWFLLLDKLFLFFCFYLRMMFVPAVPDAFSEDTILLYIVGKQNFNRVKVMIVCGDVHDFHFSESKAGQWNYKTFVHVEMVINKNYLICVSLACSSILTIKCVCKTFKNKHNKCKHVVALLLTLFLLAKCPNSPLKWITNQKRKFVPIKYLFD